MAADDGEVGDTRPPPPDADVVDLVGEAMTDGGERAAFDDVDDDADDEDGDLGVDLREREW